MHRSTATSTASPASLAALAALASLAALATDGLAAADWTAIPTGRTDYQIWRGDVQLFTIETRVVGPGWAQPDISAMPKQEGKSRVFEATVGFKSGRGKAGGASQNPEFAFRYAASQPAANALKIDTSTKSPADADAVGVAVVVSSTDLFGGGKGVVRPRPTAKRSTSRCRSA